MRPEPSSFGLRPPRLGRFGNRRTTQFHKVISQFTMSSSIFLPSIILPSRNNLDHSSRPAMLAVIPLAVSNDT